MGEVDVHFLEPRVRAILSAPGTDLQTISAKRVRKQLTDDDGVTAEFLRENKRPIDDLIAQVFSKISEESGLHQDEGEGQDEDDADEGSKRKRSEEEEDGEAGYEDGEDGEEEVDDEQEVAERPKKKAKRTAKTELSDAEYARQLSNELNGRSRSARSGSSTRGRGRGAKANGGAKRGRKVKSAETVDTGDEEEDAAPKKKRGGGGFKKEYVLSEALAAVVNAEKMSRPQVVKNLWDYIKGHSLQNPSDKREIVCDDRLRAMFGVDKIGMFKMSKVLGQHLHEPEA